MRSDRRRDEGRARYEGKRVIVSGAASGMGAATAELLVELGAEVHAIDIKKPEVTGPRELHRDRPARARADRRRGRQDRQDRERAVQLRGAAQHVLEPRRDARQLLRAAPPHRSGDPATCRRRRDREHRVVGRHRLDDEHGGARVGCSRRPTSRRRRRGAKPTRSASPTATGCRRKRSTRTPRCARSRWRRRGSASTA